VRVWRAQVEGKDDASMQNGRQSGREIALEEWLGTRPWRILDVSARPLDEDAMLPFAVDELECANVAAGAPPLLHLWRHRRALVLGLRDRRLPRAGRAMETFRREGHDVIVRSSGGAAVPLDEGVLNVTLVVPLPAGGVSVRREFAAMARLVAEAVARLDGRLAVSVGEVAGSYCPGDYDLSVGGRKFCGIAQRRKLGACAVQAFINVEGAGRARAETAARFYRLAGGGAADGSAPAVAPESAASLSEWSDRMAVSALAEAFCDLLREKAGVLDISRHYGEYDRPLLSDMAARMKVRYDAD